MAKKKKKKKRVRVPRKLARSAWERSGAGPHKDKKRESKLADEWEKEEVDN